MRIKRVFRKGLQGGMIVLLAAGSVQVGAAETYFRWMDDRGNTVLSDRPPVAGVDYEVISGTSGLNQSRQTNAGTETRTTEPKVKIEGEQLTQGPDTAVTPNPEICEVARKNLETLNTFARVQVRDDEGNISYLGDEEKEAQRNEAQALMELHCG